MATIELPSFSGKDFWRNARLLFWSFMIAFVALDIFNLVEPPAFIAPFMYLLYIGSAWVVAYHFLQAMKK
jgi:hypothetical protein